MTRPWVIVSINPETRIVGNFPTEIAAMAALAELKVWTGDFNGAEVVQLLSKRALMRRYKQHGLVTL